jgi:hypothetical protein
MEGWYRFSGSVRLHLLHLGKPVCKPDLKPQQPIYSEADCNKLSRIGKVTKCTTCLQIDKRNETEIYKKLKNYHHGCKNNINAGVKG